MSLSTYIVQDLNNTLKTVKIQINNFKFNSLKFNNYIQNTCTNRLIAIIRTWNIIFVP